MKDMALCGPISSSRARCERDSGEFGRVLSHGQFHGHPRFQVMQGPVLMLLQACLTIVLDVHYITGGFATFCVGDSVDLALIIKFVHPRKTRSVSSYSHAYSTVFLEKHDADGG